MRRLSAVRVLAGLLVAGLVLLVVELGLGALDYGAPQHATPCAPSPSPLTVGGLDGAVQRVVLDGLEGAACELGTTRERLVLSFGPAADGTPARWDDATIERAVRAGLERSIDAAVARGDLPGLAAGALRALARRAPVAWLVGGGREVADVVDALQGIAGDLLDAIGG